MRLTLEIPDETHRQIKTLAAFHGLTMKDFILQRTLASREPEQLADDEEEVDATEWIMQRPELLKNLRLSIQQVKEGKVRTFNSIEELRHEIGLE